MDKPPHHDKMSSIEEVLVVKVEAFIALVCNKTNYNPALQVIPTKLGVSLKIMFNFDKLLSSMRDSPLTNYSVFCHPPRPYSALPISLLWRTLAVFSFIPESPFINLCAQSTTVA